jgi:3'(2'), 5'-bisphosphate nucleotidase
VPFHLTDVRALAQLARSAGQIILKYRDQMLAGKDVLGLEAKGDGSPVTLADIASQEHILEGLENLGLMQPVVAEEASAPDVSKLNRYYLIDPLDGTKAFVEGGDEFTVNIGFIQKGLPVMGVLHSPVSNETYYTDGKKAYHLSAGDLETVIEARKPGSDGIHVIVNRTEDWSGKLKNFLEGYNVLSTVQQSSARKLGLIAHGHFDLYPRFGKTCEWDIAAGDAILRAAGGSVKTLDGLDLAYGKPQFINPPFIARGKS